MEGLYLFTTKCSWMPEYFVTYFLSLVDHVYHIEPDQHTCSYKCTLSKGNISQYELLISVNPAL